MPTLRQKKLAKALVDSLDNKDEPTMMGEMLESVGYKRSVALHKPGEILEQKGVQEELQEVYGFTEENAKRVVKEIMLSPDAANRDRLTAADMTLKVFGSYAPNKVQSTNVNVEIKGDISDLEKLRLKYEQELKAKLIE